MKRDVKMFFLGVLAAFTGTVVAQTPTIFNAIRVLGASDLRGDIVNASGDVTVDDNLVVTGTCTGCGGSPGGSDGQLQYNDNGGFGGLSFGTSGQVLTSNGDAMLPTWEDAGGGVSFPLLAPNGSFGSPSYGFMNLSGAGLRASTDFGNQLILETSGSFDTLNIQSQNVISLFASNDLNLTSNNEDIFIDAAALATIEGTTGVEIRRAAGPSIILTNAGSGGEINLDLTGALRINSDEGTAGECLKSQGPAMPPIWTTC